VTWPIRELEAWAAWCAEADRLGLHRGERVDLDGLLVAVRIPMSRADLDRILAERTRLARLRRPAFRLEGLTIVGEPLGLADNLADVVAELRRRIRDAHRQTVLDDIDRQITEGRSERAAVRSWDCAVRTVRRWRSETGQKRPRMAAGAVKTGLSVETSRRNSSSADSQQTTVAGGTGSPPVRRPTSRRSAA
jgi:hypothetical protein